jgi:PKD repeat protein
MLIRCKATVIFFERHRENDNTRMRKITIALAFSLAAVSSFGQTTRVLFVGNSYTGNNNLHTLTQNLAESLGDTMYVEKSTPGGSTFNAHSTNSTTLGKIGQGNWDYVILQAQSQEPSFPPSQVASDTYPYAEILVDSVMSASPCAVPVFFMTWGRENGDQNNCQFYPPICTYDGMQNRLRNSYLEMGTDNDAEVSPVGAAWQYVRDNHPTIDLYSSDGSHPSIRGSYLAACVHYATVYKKSPVGATFISTLGASTALTLQSVAEMVVLDSLDNWNAGVRNVTADFSSSATDFDAMFTYTGDNGDDFIWDFGDGNTSTMENPTNTFSANGTYTVELIATDGCTSDTTTADVVIAASGIGVNELQLIRSIRQFDGQCAIDFNEQQEGTYAVFDTQGRLVTQQTFNGTMLNVTLPESTGMYILKLAFANQHQETFTLVR